MEEGMRIMKIKGRSYRVAAVENIKTGGRAPKRQQAEDEPSCATDNNVVQPELVPRREERGGGR